MSFNNRSGGKGAGESVQKLSTDADVLRREAQAMEEASRSGNEEGEQIQLRKIALLADQMQRPATVHSIEIHGAKNTRRGFLDPIFQPLVRDNRNAGTTLGDVLARLEEAVSKLERFDIFKPQPTLFISEPQQTDPATTATDLDISIRVAERSRFMLRTGTDLGNTEGSAYGNLLWRNMFGGAESLSLNASAGTRTRSAYSAAFSTPVKSNPSLRLSLEGVASSTQKPWASHEEVLKGGSMRVTWLSPAGDQNSLAYSGTWRQLTGLTGSASPTVRADAGDSVKSSLCHTFTRDRRDNPMLPQKGYLIRTITELAGWGPLAGDVSFSKSEIELAGAVPLTLPGTTSDRTGVSVGGGLRFGLLYPLPLGYSLAGKTSPSRVNDRFQLGGPTDVRGFKLGGLGPRDGGDAVGGDVFAAGSANLMLPLPRFGPGSPLRFQVFANAGRLVAMRDKGDAKEAGDGSGLHSRKGMNGMRAAVMELASGLPSAAAGFGLVYAHPVARFELNFSLPLVLRRGEEGRKGLQVGVGINFL
ncbi:Sorting assembly machinery 50 kDa subunit [Pleurostoma richardsiae]|uniref:Sorting assembly machinery 50 kDa subunit n=1 Tax=Pleurostoma richardsiae TaxID=41990 RepID=A0AA38RIQ0_9PEZI|nr:Sorting assembly machinery 50 kDa subunit [Pleurostoma richardsiae]